MKRISLLLGILIISVLSYSQFTDTLRFMHYNLLNYRNVLNECNDTSNNAHQKDLALHIIHNYIKADVLTFNEVQANQSTLDSLLQNAINKSSKVNYLAAPFSANSSLGNALIYNPNKLKWKSHTAITHALDNSKLVRQIDVHTLYVKNGDLGQRDTTFIIVYTAHLKAGSTTADLAQRKLATQAVMNYHSTHYTTTNYILCGDLNVRSSTEESFQTLINYPTSAVNFYDPVNQLGAWNSNSNFAAVHTQSTRASNTNSGCFSAGGLDDRFDFILCGNEIIQNARKVLYLPGSYRIVGNDGMHFNKNILSPLNTSAPSEVINALYNLSDHLPVVLELVAASAFTSIDTNKDIRITYTNPADNTLRIISETKDIISVSIYDSKASLIYSSNSSESYNSVELNTEFWANGMYVLELKFADSSLRKKVLVLHK